MIYLIMLLKEKNLHVELKTYGPLEGHLKLEQTSYG
jgi:hypothetical protein